MAISLEERRRRAEEERKKRGLPPTQPTPAPEPPKTAGVYTDKTGKETGFEYGGKTYYGLNPKEKELFLKQQEGIAAQFPATQRFTEQQQEAVQQEQIQKQKEELFSKEIPKPDLARERVSAITPLTETPILGAGFETLAQLTLTGLRLLEKKTGKKIIKNEDIINLNQPRILENEALTAIEKQVYDEGIDASIAFGALMEALPGGKYVGYAGVETPRSDIEEIRKTMKKEKTRITKYETWVRDGTLNPEVAEERANQFIEQMQGYQSRIQLLSIYSSSLQYEGDRMVTIETEIQTNLELIQAIQSRIIAYQGQKITPSEWDVLFSLQSLGVVEEEE